MWGQPPFLVIKSIYIYANHMRICSHFGTKRIPSSGLSGYPRLDYANTMRVLGVRAALKEEGPDTSDNMDMEKGPLRLK